MAGSRAGLRKVNKSRGSEQQRQHGDHKARQGKTVRPFGGIGAAERKAAPQEHDPHADPCGKAEQGADRGQIAAAQPDDHAQRAAEKGECADHYDHAEYKPHGGR